MLAMKELLRRDNVHDSGHVARYKHSFKGAGTNSLGLGIQSTSPSPVKPNILKDSTVKPMGPLRTMPVDSPP